MNSSVDVDWQSCIAGSCVKQNAQPLQQRPCPSRSSLRVEAQARMLLLPDEEHFASTRCMYLSISCGWLQLDWTMVLQAKQQASTRTMAATMEAPSAPSTSETYPTEAARRTAFSEELTPELVRMSSMPTRLAQDSLYCCRADATTQSPLSIMPVTWCRDC